MLASLKWIRKAIEAAEMGGILKRVGIVLETSKSNISTFLELALVEL